MNYTKVNSVGRIEIWQTPHSPETAQGGYTLVNSNYVEGDVIKAGTPVNINDATRKATVIKTAIIVENANNTATKYKVAKGSGLKVGDIVGLTAGGTAYAISNIDDTYDEYDELTLGTTLGVDVTVGTVLTQSTESGETAADFLTCHGLTYEDYIVNGNTLIAVVRRGTVYARRIPPISSDMKEQVPTIIFSESY